MTDNNYSNVKGETINGVTFITDKNERKAFLKFPYRHYNEDSYWIPPLYMDQKKLINTEKNSFYQNADIALFLAENNGKTAGRIAAIIDHRYNEYHDTRTGFFGFFECIDNEQLARWLFKAAEDWLIERGMQEVKGPTNPSMMDEIGVLVDGFEEYPSLLMPYNKSYYDRLIRANGYEKEIDLLAYYLNQDMVDLERLRRAEKVVRHRIPGLKFRNVNLKKMDREIEIIRDIFNRAWSDNWGFIPLTKQEFEDLGKDLKLIIDTDIAYIVEKDGEPVGFSVSLPDYNQVFRHMDGTLFPTGIFKLLYYRRRIDHVRTALMGIIPEYQSKGLDALLHRRTVEDSKPKGYYSSELSWILESNTQMIRVAERLGAELEKTYRMYTKSLD